MTARIEHVDEAVIKRSVRLLGYVGNAPEAEQDEYGYCSVTAEREDDHQVPVYVEVAE